MIKIWVFWRKKYHNSHRNRKRLKLWIGSKSLPPIRLQWWVRCLLVIQWPTERSLEDLMLSTLWFKIKILVKNITKQMFICISSHISLSSRTQWVFWVLRSPESSRCPTPVGNGDQWLQSIQFSNISYMKRDLTFAVHLIVDYLGPIKRLQQN